MNGVETLAIATYQLRALLAAVLVGSGLSISVIALLVRNRTKQRTLAAILDDTIGQVNVPVEVISESPPHNETSALMVRLGKAVGRVDSRGHLEEQLERGAMPLKAGEYLTLAGAFAVMLGGALAVVSKSPIGAVVGVLLVAVAAWRFPESRCKKRSKKMQAQLPDALALMAAAVEGGQTFQRAIDMYRHDSRPPLSAELDRVMAEVALGSDLVVALENMANRSGIEDLKWAVEAVRIQQSTGGRLAPILHTLADFMRVRQEVRREVQTLSAEGRISGYVLFALPIFMGLAISVLDPGYLKPMFHGLGLIVLICTAGLMGIGYLIVRKMVNIEV
jgi:tight adherence protein B